MRKTSFVVLVGLVCASPALAQEPAPPAGTARYSFNRVSDGFLRLDNVSGQVSHCVSNSVGWACLAVPEDSAALEMEIARLQDEVAGLKSDVAALRPPADLTPRSKRDEVDKFSESELRQDMERARVALENAWRRLVDMIVTFQKDMMRKG